MSRKKIIILILCFSVIATIATYLINITISAKSDDNIKLMEYTPPKVVGENGYQIDKYENIEINQWIDENEVLTLTKKEDFKNPDSSISVRYCSVYNLNTKESKDFKDVYVADFLGISPDKKYVLYAEPRVIPKISSDEWKKALETGDLLHRNVKMLNLVTGEITDVKTEKVNSDAEFKWIGNNKIFINYFRHWSIIDPSGKVYANGSYNVGEYDDPWLSGTDDIKDLGDKLEGVFYYTQLENGREGVKLCSMNIKTKEIKTIFVNKDSSHASQNGKTIIIDNYKDIGKESNGTYKRIFGVIIMDESGKITNTIDLPEGMQHSDFVLSPDGSKIAYVEGSDRRDSEKVGQENFLKVIDTKTGEEKEILKHSSLKEIEEDIENSDDMITVIDKYGNKVGKEPRVHKDISNICWSNNGRELSFSYGDSTRFNSYIESYNSKINSYIVSFER